MEIIVAVAGLDERDDPAPEEYRLTLAVAVNPFDHQHHLTARVVSDPWGIGQDYLVIQQDGPGVPAQLVLEDASGDPAPDAADVLVPASLVALHSGNLPAQVLTGPAGAALVVSLPAPAP